MQSPGRSSCGVGLYYLLAIRLSVLQVQVKQRSWKSPKLCRHYDVLGSICPPSLSAPSPFLWLSCNLLKSGGFFTCAFNKRSEIVFLNFFQFFHVIQQFFIESNRNHLLCHTHTNVYTSIDKSKYFE